MNVRRILFRAGLIVFTLGALALSPVSPAAAQSFPSKQIRIIVSSSPGTITDVLARILAPEMTKILGQQVFVENKTGASDRIAYEYVATQVPADGYTIVLVSLNALVSLPLTTSMPFDPVRELPAFIILTESKLDLAATPAPRGTLKTFDDFVSFAKANPGKLNYGSSSSTTRILTEIILKNRGLNVVYVPFSNTAASLTALSSGEVQIGITPETNAVASGFTVLAQSGDARSPNFANAPTFAQLGIPQMRGSTNALGAPAKTPKAIIDRLFAAAAQAVRQPEIRAQLAKAQLDAVEPTSPEAAAKMQADLAKTFADVARDLGIKPE